MRRGRVPMASSSISTTCISDTSAEQQVEQGPPKCACRRLELLEAQGPTDPSPRQPRVRTYNAGPTWPTALTFNFPFAPGSLPSGPYTPPTPSANPLILARCIYGSSLLSSYSPTPPSPRTTSMALTFPVTVLMASVGTQVRGFVLEYGQ